MGSKEVAAALAKAKLTGDGRGWMRIQGSGTVTVVGRREDGLAVVLVLDMDCSGWRGGVCGSACSGVDLNPRLRSSGRFKRSRGHRSFLRGDGNSISRSLVKVK